MSSSASRRDVAQARSDAERKNLYNDVNTGSARSGWHRSSDIPELVPRANQPASYLFSENGVQNRISVCTGIASWEELLKRCWEEEGRDEGYAG